MLAIFLGMVRGHDEIYRRFRRQLAKLAPALVKNEASISDSSFDEWTKYEFALHELRPVSVKSIRAILTWKTLNCKPAN